MNTAFSVSSGKGSGTQQYTGKIQQRTDSQHNKTGDHQHMLKDGRVSGDLKDSSQETADSCRGCSRVPEKRGQKTGTRKRIDPIQKACGYSHQKERPCEHEGHERRVNAVRKNIVDQIKYKAERGDGKGGKRRPDQFPAVLFTYQYRQYH